MREIFYKPVDFSALSDEDMLLIVGDHCSYYFDDLVFKNKDGSIGKYYSGPHIGMYTDTYLIEGEDNTDIDIRWYVLNGGLEFYSLNIEGRGLWIENRGDGPLVIKDGRLALDLQPNERTKIREKSREDISFRTLS